MSRAYQPEVWELERQPRGHYECRVPGATQSRLRPSSAPEFEDTGTRIARILRTIQSLLEIRLRADDDRGIQERRRRLKEAFESVPAADAGALLKRLSTRRNDDVLSKLFHGRIAAVTGRVMLDILRAKIRSLPKPPATPARTPVRLRLISDLKVKPSVIRVHEHESVRISFILPAAMQTVSCFVMEDEQKEGTAARFFTISPTAGYHSIIWDGTFDGMRNRPPVTGVYRVRLWVTDLKGQRESLVIPIKVLNPHRKTVLPRTQSGLALQSLTFNGSLAVLTDAGGNTIRVRAISGLKPKHHRNKEGLDYTKPIHQSVPDRGPLPAGLYVIRKHTVQQPVLTKLRGRSTKVLAYPTGGLASTWGPFRVPLNPFQVGNRSGFFVHLDVTNDGTAGCIGVHPDDEGKFNQIMSLIALMPNDELPVTVKYP